MTETEPLSLDLYLSPEHACNYLPQRMARTAFIDPRHTPDTRLYSLLAAHGFRRSGMHVYRPHCAACQACIPLRVPVAEFQPDRTQKRLLRRNQDLAIRIAPAEFAPEHFALYRRYLTARHPGGGMDEAGETEYRQFLFSSWGRSWLVEMRSAAGLAAVAIVDELDEALSAVYTFYDPSLPRRSLGTYAVLWQIAEARRRGLKWLYLGYWIAESRKMAYKNRFRPFEQLDAAGWQRHA